MADGTVKDIGQIKVGAKIANAVPGKRGTDSNAVTAVFVTKTDHDFNPVVVVAASTAQPRSTSRFS